jgi:hypothetical protein
VAPGWQATVGEDSMEEEIWALEETWYAHHRDRAPDQAFALIHDRFLGWPAVESSIVDKEGLIAFITDEDAGVDFCDFEFEDPSGVQVMGDTAINHYRIRFMGKNLDGSEIDQSIHVTHTWIKEDSRWKLLSGMSYEVEKS